jgi:hypothetical protein
MCATPFWGVVSAIACAYFAYAAYAHVRDGDVAWSHDWESVLTAGVWIVLIVGLISETRCRRERIVFGFLLANFTLAFSLAIWQTPPVHVMWSAREISLTLWILAALASLRTLRTPAAPPPLTGSSN